MAKFENAFLRWVAANGLSILRVSIGIIYFWFGILKFFPGISPAEELAVSTIHELTFGLLPDIVSLYSLAIWECGLGLLLVSGRYLRFSTFWMLLHMVCTFTPVLFFPELIFNEAPHSFTLVGQYIMKNIVIISAGIILYASTKVKLVFQPQ